MLRGRVLLLLASTWLAAAPAEKEDLLAAVATADCRSYSEESRRRDPDHYLERCAPWWLKAPDCRAAFVEAARGAPVDLFWTIMRGCARAYCPRLGGKAPRLCGVTEQPGEAEEIGLWVPFSVAVYEHESGHLLDPAKVQHTVEVLEQKRRDRLRDELTRALAPVEMPRIRMRPTADGTLIEWFPPRAEAAARSWTVPEDPDDDVLDQLSKLIAPSGKEARGKPVQLQCDRELTFKTFKPVMNRLERLGVAIDFATLPRGP